MLPCGTDYLTCAKEHFSASLCRLRRIASLTLRILVSLSRLAQELNQSSPWHHCPLLTKRTSISRPRSSPAVRSTHPRISRACQPVSAGKRPAGAAIILHREFVIAHRAADTAVGPVDGSTRPCSTKRSASIPRTYRVSSTTHDLDSQHTKAPPPQYDHD
jgi:hypothetical protein